MNTPFDPDPTQVRRSLVARLRASFLTGLVVIAPVGLTIWLIWSVVGWIDGFVLPLVPKAYHPDRLLQDFLGLDPSMQFNVRGLGVVIFLIFTVMVGWAAKGLIGRSMIRFAESLVERTPVVRTIYSGIKQISETIFAQSERSFETACLIEYPRRGIWGIAFVTGPVRGPVAAVFGPAPMLNCFIPTTPHPTSGFYLLVPESETREVHLTVEEAFKVIMSAGLVTPDQPHDQTSLPGLER